LIQFIGGIEVEEFTNKWEDVTVFVKKGVGQK